MKEIGDKNNFFKNPIGVIGIFLVLTEAIASCVIMNSTLTDMQNTILVLFIVFFPCVVLLVFYRLVTKHHEKLYSPSDYRDENNFVSTYNSATQNDVKVPIPDASVSSVTNDNLSVVKDVLADIIKVQKRIIPSVEETAIPQGEKDILVSMMDDSLEDMRNDERPYLVEVSPMYKSKTFIEDLIQKGYDAKIYRFNPIETNLVPYADHKSIWLGSRIPVEMAIDIIRTAKKFYPHLKYVKLSDGSRGEPDFVLYQIFIGGSTATAERYGLIPLSDEDFEKLYHISNIEELHDFVKSFD